MCGARAALAVGGATLSPRDGASPGRARNAALTAEERERVEAGLCACGCGEELPRVVLFVAYDGTPHHGERPDPAARYASPACRQRCYRRRKARGEVYTREQRRRDRQESAARELLARAAALRRQAVKLQAEALQLEKQGDRLLVQLAGQLGLVGGAHDAHAARQGYPSAECSKCGRAVAVVDGHLVEHHFPALGALPRSRCPGSGEVPYTFDDDDLWETTGARSSEWLAGHAASSSPSPRNPYPEDSRAAQDWRAGFRCGVGDLVAGAAE